MVALLRTQSKMASQARSALLLLAVVFIGTQARNGESFFTSAHKSLSSTD